MGKMVRSYEDELIVVDLPLDRNPAAMYLSQLGPSSRKVQKSALDRVAGILTQGQADSFSLDWSKVRYQHIAAVRSYLLDVLKATTVNRIIAAIRGTMKQAWLMNLIGVEEYHRIAAVKNVLGKSLPAGRELLPDEIACLLRGCIEEKSLMGKRDAALIALLYGGGLRRAEVVGLTLSNYDAKKRQLRVHGKRSKERYVFLSPSVAAYMEIWLVERGDQEGALFPVLYKSRIISHIRHMTPQAVFNLLKRRAKRLNIADFSPHDFRRTFVSNLLDSGVDIATVAKMAGHDSITTTVRYDRRSDQVKAEAACRLVVPIFKEED